MPFRKKQLTQKVPPFDFEGFRKRGEIAVASAVGSLSIPEVCSAPAGVVPQLVMRLRLQVPKLLLGEAEHQIVDYAGDDCLDVEVPFEDPCGIVNLINYPELPRSVEFDIDVERKRVIVMGYQQDPPTEIHAQLAHVLSEYQRNIELTAQHIERYNAALPYSVAAAIHDRVAGLSDVSCADEPDGRADRIETLEILAELVVEGKLFAVHEFDRETGAPRTRYHSTRHRPETGSNT